MTEKSDIINKLFNFINNFVNEEGSLPCILGLDASVLKVGKGFEQIFGFRPDETIGEKISSFMAPDSRDEFAKILNGPESGHSTGYVTFTVKTGGEVRTELSLFRAPPELCDCFIGIIKKIGTESVLPAADLTRYFSIAIEESPVSVVITDKDGTIEYVNPRFSRLTGYSFEEVIGKNPRILKSGEQGPEFYKEMWGTISSGRIWRGDFHNIKKNGESYWESASISPVKNSSGIIDHYVAVKENITTRKLAQEALKEREEALSRQNSEMLKNLDYARFIVNMLLPEVAPVISRLRTEYRNIPLEAVGGDFFSFNQIDENTLGVFIGDVSGHGVSAALFLSLLKSETDRLNRSAAESPAEYIRELNRALYQRLTTYFITALYGFFQFTEKGAQFTFAKGGHTPPIVYRASDKTAVMVPSRGRPVGLFEEFESEEITLDLYPGDRLFLYTDGLNETVNHNGQMLGDEGLLRIIKNGAGINLARSIDRAFEDFASYRGGADVTDDMVLIGFEVI